MGAIICTNVCGFALADIVKNTDAIAGGCDNPQFRSANFKGILMQACFLDGSIVASLPANSATDAIKTGYFDATAPLGQYTFIGSVANFKISPAEYKDIKVNDCDVPFKKATTQKLEFEHKIKMESATDKFFDYALLNFLKDNGKRLRLYVVDCDNNIYPLVQNIKSTIPVFERGTVTIQRGEEEVSSCLTIEVKKVEIEFCNEVMPLVAPYITGDLVPFSLLEIIA